MNLAQIWIEPGRDFAMVTVTNIGGAKADQALKALARAVCEIRAAVRELWEGGSRSRAPGAGSFLRRAGH